MPDNPVERIATDPSEIKLEAGTALCLSGGGYRAMLFHLGVLWRLYEARLLQDVQRISSVSGGSITAGVLALKWRQLSFDPDAPHVRFRAHGGFTDSCTRRRNHRCRRHILGCGSARPRERPGC